MHPDLAKHAEPELTLSYRDFYGWAETRQFSDTELRTRARWATSNDEATVILRGANVAKWRRGGFEARSAHSDLVQR